MAFLEPETYVGTWIEVRHTAGSASWIPYDVLGGDVDSYTPADVLQYTDALDEDDVEEIIVHRNAIGVRLSASGYMDATEWSVHDSIEDARTALADELDMGEGTSQDGEDVEERAREELPDDADRVRVEFYRQREGADWERDPIAVFPELEERGGLVQSYVHVGQHGAASMELVRSAEYERTDDGDEDTRKLADELERIGYRFQRTRTVWIRRDEDGGPDDGPGQGTLPFPPCPDCTVLPDGSTECSDCGETPAPDAPRGTPDTLPDYADLRNARDEEGDPLTDVYDEDPGEGEGETCPECERGLGDDYTEGCDGCADEREEKRATDLARELAEVQRELATALDAREDARAQLADARTADPAERDPGPAREAEDRADMLSEHVRELESRAVELETALAELEPEETPLDDAKLGAGVKLARLRPGTFASFTPDATTDAKGLKLLDRSGARVRIVRALGFADADLDETGPMYRIEFDDGADTDAFLDELEPLDEPAESVPFGAPGLAEEERLRRFALRALELAGVNERQRAEALQRGEDPPPTMGDYLAMAASRWGLSLGTLPEDPPPCYACDEKPGTVLGYVQDEPHQWCPECHAYEYGTGEETASTDARVQDGKVLTVRHALAVLHAAELSIGPDATLILSLTGSELEDANVNELHVIADDGSRYVEVRVQHPSLAPFQDEPDTRRPHEKNPERWEETEPGSDVYRYKGTPLPYDGAPAYARGIECAPRPDLDRHGLLSAQTAPSDEETARAERGRMRRVDRLAKLLPERRIPGDRREDLELRKRVEASGEDLTDEERERRRRLARGDWS